MLLLGLPVAGFWLWAFWPPALIASALIVASFAFPKSARVLSTIALVVGLGPIALMVLALGTPADSYSEITVENLSSADITVDSFDEEEALPPGATYTFGAIEYSGRVEVRTADGSVNLQIDSVDGFGNRLTITDVEVTSGGAE